MRSFTGNPTFQNLAVFIKNSHMVTRQFPAPGKFFFRQYHMGRLINHNHNIITSISAYRKRHVFCKCITIAWFYFMQPVFTACCQLTADGLKFQLCSKDQLFACFKSGEVSHRFSRTFVFIQNL